MTAVRVAHSSLVASSRVLIARPPTPAADPAFDLALAARAALKRAGSIRDTARSTFYAAEAEVEQLRALVARLEANR